MSIFKRRPLALFCAFFILFLFVWFFSSPKLKLISIIISAILLASLFIVRRKYRCRALRSGFASVIILLLCAIIFSSLCSISAFDLNEKALLENNLGREHEYKLVVCSVKYSGDGYAAYKCRVLAKDNQKELFSNLCVLLQVSGDMTVNAGDTISLRTSPQITKNGVRESFYYSEGMLLKLYQNADSIYKAEADSITEKTASGFYKLLGNARKALASKSNRLFSSRDSSIIRALFYGEKSGFPQSLDSDLKELGVSHIIAISGMHLSVISALLAFITEKFIHSRRASVIFYTAVIIIYAFICMFSFSIVRSVLMLLVFNLSYFSARRKDPATSLFFSCAVICFVFPSSVINVTFLLSFLSTLGIICASKFCTKKYFLEKFFKNRPRARKSRVVALLHAVYSSFVITLCASAFAMPAIYFFFDGVSLLCFVANLLLSPIVGLLLPLCAITLVTPGFISLLIAPLCSGLCDLLVFVTNALAGGSSLRLSLPDYLLPTTVILTLLFILLSMLFTDHTRIFSLCSFLSVCIIFVSVFVITHRNNAASLYLSSTKAGFAVGDNDSTLIFAENKSEFEAVEGVISKRENTRTRLTLLLLDYSDETHSFIEYLFNEYALCNLIIYEKSEGYQSLCEMLRERGASFYSFSEDFSWNSFAISISEDSFLISFNGYTVKIGAHTLVLTQPSNKTQNYVGDFYIRIPK